MDVLKSIYTGMNGDMVTLNLTINGDPTLIKQDDWLYSVNPNALENNYNKWDTMGQDAFAALYGHIRTDVGDVIVYVSINTPMDLDLDGANQGLVTPPANTTPSMFSGLYKIITIENKFAGGVFTQELSMCRYINQDLINKYKLGLQRTDAAAGQPFRDLSNSGTIQVTQTSPYVAGYDPSRPAWLQ
jgi:hypothetical protein